jgi:hypothetical protein
MDATIAANSPTNAPSIKYPSAFLPILMSLAALAVVIGHMAIYGIVHETDEGTPAHLFQLLMGGQLPIILFFLVKWLPQAPKKTLQILALQIVAALPVLACVFFLDA